MFVVSLYDIFFKIWGKRKKNKNSSLYTFNQKPSVIGVLMS